MRIPHQGSNKADALSAELQGRQFNGSGMLTPVIDLVNRTIGCKRTHKKRSPVGAISLERSKQIKRLRRARLVVRLREYATSVERIINDFAHCRRFGINIHSVARFQVSDDALGCDFESHAVQF
jgi:hypothetical protein